MGEFEHYLRGQNSNRSFFLPDEIKKKPPSRREALTSIRLEMERLKRQKLENLKRERCKQLNRDISDLTRRVSGFNDELRGLAQEARIYKRKG